MKKQTLGELEEGCGEKNRIKGNIDYGERENGERKIQLRNQEEEEKSINLRGRKVINVGYGRIKKMNDEERGRTMKETKVERENLG